eukprot:PRCOL_00002056-RA
MLFAPLEFAGVELWRERGSPYGAFGWQGVVPARAERMAERLTRVVSEQLLSLEEAFANIESAALAALLAPTVEDAIRRHAENGDAWARLLRGPLLRKALRDVVDALKDDISTVLDLDEVVRSAFVRDVRVLVELFQKVGSAELSFLVNSGAFFGFALGVAQGACWRAYPHAWTLPVAGAVVGYVTNLVAITLLFDPAEPIDCCGLFEVQAMFSKRQPEVSMAFSDFLSERVLTSPRLIAELSSGNFRREFEALLRRTVPALVPDSVVNAAAMGLQELATESRQHATHAYLAEQLALRDTLCVRLMALPPKAFEELLHPVFQEDEIILIVVGGVLGALVGLAQMRFGVGSASAPVIARAAASLATRGAKGTRGNPMLAAAAKPVAAGARSTSGGHTR